ncbi:uncharacterized protein LOC117581604 [Drosophila guanche]|uniref:Protein TsetseEP domain-containing protein n=1 Tax=Drosophila guanche TaxID=7266 RepID=A0A3B0JLR1_DROGU|nr:uncharacterized protein LOC117581604 [Drosophila guanche]SPP73591.1 Hypothetical predicted protein [Drosophila guanche]
MEIAANIITLLLLIPGMCLGSHVDEQPRTVETLLSYLETNESTTKQCFARYLPQLENEGATWSKSYSRCLWIATTGRQSVVTNVAAAQNQIREAALGISAFIDDCLGIADSLAFFNCFAKMSKRQLATVYTISYNASEDALRMSQQLGTIEVEHYLCTNRTEHTYVEGTDRVFRDLDQCLQQNEEH